MHRLLSVIASVALVAAPLHARNHSRSHLQEDADRPVIERVPLDRPFASMFENQTRSSSALIEHFVDSVREDLELRELDVMLDYDPLLSVIEIRGSRSEVEIARSGLADAMVPYRERFLELDERARAAAVERERAEQLALERRTVNVEWPGGPLADLLARIQASVPCNVILAEAGVGELVIPPLAVRLVAPDVFFLSLEAIPLAGGHALEVAVVSPDAKSAESGSPTAAATRPVIVVRSGRPGRDPNPTVQRIFDLGEFPDASDDQLRMLVEAIDFTMQANDSADAVKVRFHEPSRILFVKGPLDAVELIAEIIAAKGMSGL